MKIPSDPLSHYIVPAKENMACCGISSIRVVKGNVIVKGGFPNHEAYLKCGVSPVCLKTN